MSLFLADHGRQAAFGADAATGAAAEEAALHGGGASGTAGAPGGSATLPAPAGRNVFFYTVEGEAKIGEETVPEHALAQVGDGDGLAVASENGCRILFGHADPIGEPVVAHGPFVMNSEAEIAQAIRDYQAGKFGGL